MKKQPAFTLLETIIALAIICLLFAFVTPVATRSRQAAQERQFWSEMRVQWQAAQVRAKAMHKVTWMIDQEQTGVICFHWMAADGARNAKVQVPATIKVTPFSTIVMDEKGFVSPTTLRFQSRLDQQYYYMKIQLGWGGYRVEKSSQPSFPQK